MNTSAVGPVGDVVRHARAMWPNSEVVDFRWTAGPVEELLPEFRVVRVAPGESLKSWLYISSGVAEPQAGKRVHEFALLSPAETPRHVETLAMVAHWQATGRDVHVGSMMNLGRPWFEGSGADHLLVTPLYAFPPECGDAPATGGTISILWLVPVYANEGEYARRRGMERLEERFERAGVNLIDPRRPSVVGT
ncbi:suppressor of fused domain protein [Streptomyces sp. HC307]|uniref:suppressor of fused domain protein n=1 Tax=Streptomyces flavusporus TaxID=3385496 RepID=UPI0039173015